MSALLKSHYTCAELSAIQVPGLPTTKAGIAAKADRECWPYLVTTGVGGSRREYAPPPSVIDSIRAKLAEELVRAGLPGRVVRREEQMPLIETSDQALKADARKGVLNALELLMARSGYPMKKAATVLIDTARLGSASDQLVAMLKMARDERGRKSVDGLPSVRSLLRFVEYERAGMLAPKRRERDMSVPEWAPFFMGFYQRPEKPTVEHAYHQFRRDWIYSHPTADVPSIWQVRRFMKKVGSVSLQAGRMGDRELKSLKPFFRRGFEHLLPSDIYSADGHTFDAEVAHPLHGRPFRPEITTIVDIATRRAVGWSVGLAESALAVLDALRHAALSNGIPAVFYVDNGSGYKNQMMTDSATGFMGRLGTEMVNSLPYNSQARGVIERLHQTIWVKAAKELPGYIGRDMDREARLLSFKLSRKAIASSGQAVTMPLMSWSTFVAFCVEKVEEYNSRPHRSLPKIVDGITGRRRHMTPDERWSEHVSKGFAPHSVSDDEARPLFRPQELRVVRRCELELFGNRYFARSLEEFHGSQLRVGYDIHDPQFVWVYDDDGRFLCKAELDANKRDYMPRSVIDRARDRRAAGREKRLEAKLDEVRAERNGVRVIEESNTVNIPGFLAITREQLAARSVQSVVAAPASPKVARREVIDVEPKAITSSPAWSVPKEPSERWEEWKKLSALSEEEIEDEKAKKWRSTYQMSAEFRAYQKKSV